MSFIDIRKQSLSIETIYHEGGARSAHPVRVATAAAVIRNPYAGVYQEDLMPFMAALRELGTMLSAELVNALGADEIEVYGKGAIVGVNGELEHGAVWHEAGGWALRAALGEPKAMVPSAKAVASAGYRLIVPLHYIHAAYVRSHYTIGEVGIQDAPRPNEILFALLAGTGGRVHARLGGLTKENVSVHDGQR
tara:strand:+ start:258765 stop:259343 length:579 start_codon:yes stop_codon:yes gene_type:complete